jgi:hypothetical protein
MHFLINCAYNTVLTNKYYKYIYIFDNYTLRYFEIYSILIVESRRNFILKIIFQIQNSTEYVFIIIQYVK